MTIARKHLKTLCLFLLAIMFLGVFRPGTTHAAAAREAYYNSYVVKNAVLTSTTKPKKGKKAKTVKLKKAMTLPVVSRTKTDYVVQYKNKTYTVPKAKVRLGGLNYKFEAFDKASAEKFVNDRKYTSKSKYLIWVSLYSQHMYIFKSKNGKAGTWELIKYCPCSTGAPGYSTYYGKYTIKGKQYYWYWYGAVCAYYASRIPSGAIHSWASGGFGAPRSHGCVRVPIDYAKYVYDTIPVGSAVITM